MHDTELIQLQNGTGDTDVSWSSDFHNIPNIVQVQKEQVHFIFQLTTSYHQIFSSDAYFNLWFIGKDVNHLYHDVITLRKHVVLSTTP